jgi:hypothetical protein
MERMVPRFDPNLIRGRLTVLTCYLTGNRPAVDRPQSHPPVFGRPIPLSAQPPDLPLSTEHPLRM